MSRTRQPYSLLGIIELILSLIALSTFVLAEEQYGDFNKTEAAIGTGPFILERYERGVKLIFKRNPDYYIKGLPYVDGIEWQMTPDAAARVSLLRAGKVDFVQTTGLLSGEEAIRLQRTNPELKFLKYQSLNWGMFYMRTDQPPFNDRLVRQALSLAINRQAWLEALDFGEGCLVTGPVPCALPEWRLDPKEMDPAQAKYLAGFDREEAKRLLAQAGYPKGFSTPLYHHPGYTGVWPSRFELAVDELSKVGIMVELKPQEYGQYISTMIFCTASSIPANPTIAAMSTTLRSMKCSSPNGESWTRRSASTSCTRSSATWPTKRTKYTFPSGSPIRSITRA